MADAAMDEGSSRKESRASNGSDASGEGGSAETSMLPRTLRVIYAEGNKHHRDLKFLRCFPRGIHDLFRILLVLESCASKDMWQYHQLNAKFICEKNAKRGFPNVRTLMDAYHGTSTYWANFMAWNGMDPQMAAEAKPNAINYHGKGVYLAYEPQSLPDPNASQNMDAEQRREAERGAVFGGLLKALQYSRIYYAKPMGMIHWVVVVASVNEGRTTVGMQGQTDFGPYDSLSGPPPYPGALPVFGCYRDPAQVFVKYVVVMGLSVNAQTTKARMTAFIKHCTNHSAYWAIRMMAGGVNKELMETISQYQMIQPYLLHPDLIQEEQPPDKASWWAEGGPKNCERTIIGKLSMNKLIEQGKLDSSKSAEFLPNEYTIMLTLS